MTKFRPRKLLVPFRISSDRIGRASPKGTLGFLPIGTRLPSELARQLHHDRSLVQAARKKRNLKFIHRSALINSAVEHRQHLAEKSDFFIKPTSRRIQLIRSALQNAGIRVESPIQDLKNGTELFQRSDDREVVLRKANSNEIVIRLRQPYSRFLNRFVELVTKIHHTNVSHNDLHARNILVNRKGWLRAIDFSRAKKYATVPRSKKEFLSFFANDLLVVAQDCSLIRFPDESDPGVREKRFREMIDVLETLLHAHARAHIPTYLVVPSDIIDFSYRSRPRKIGPRLVVSSPPF